MSLSSRVRLLDVRGRPLGGLACIAAVAGKSHRLTADQQGWIEFAIEGVCPTEATIAWQAEEIAEQRIVALRCGHEDGDEQTLAKLRLRNLGYLSGGDEALAMARFAHDEGITSDLSGDIGIIPPTICKAIAERWAERHG